MRLTNQQLSEILPTATVLEGNTTKDGETVEFTEIKASGGSHEEAVRNLITEVRKFTNEGKTVYTNGGHVVEHESGRKVAILSVNIEGETAETLQQRDEQEQTRKEPSTDEEREEADKAYATTEHHHGSREEADDARDEAFEESNEKSGANRVAAHGDESVREEQKENLEDTKADRRSDTDATQNGKSKDKSKK